MKVPFDLLKAQNYEKLVTRDGRDATYVATCTRLGDKPVIVVLSGNLVQYHQQGRLSEFVQSGADLFMDIPHPHQAMMDLADKYPDRVVESRASPNSPWRVATNPSWYPSSEYRFQPVPKTVWQNFYKRTGHIWVDSVLYATKEVAETADDRMEDSSWIGAFPTTIEIPA